MEPCVTAAYGRDTTDVSPSMWRKGPPGGGLSSLRGFLLLSVTRDKMLFSPISAFYTWSTCSFDLCADHMGPFSGLKLISFAVPPTSPAPLPADAFTSAEGEVSQRDSDKRRIIGTI